MSTKAISLENATALYKDIRDRLYQTKDEYVPLARTINSLPLTEDIQLTAIDVAAVRRGIKINNQILADANITLSASDVGAAASSHTHTKSQITDFPTSLPASDVYSWAKASSKPSYTASEVGASPKPTYQNGSGTLASMSVGEIKIVLISGTSTSSIKMPSGGQYIVGGVETSYDSTVETDIGYPFSGVYSGGASISVSGYGKWCIVLRIS